jgi:DNA-binding PadR family transcriptional regulator
MERTELESCVLGVVCLRGPCTAYTVRQEFVRSFSSHWTGSAGAIYPLLQRLERARLIRARDCEWGTRSKKEFTITAAGMETLRRWIGPPLPEWTAAPTVDPIRTRLTFFAAIPPARQRQFIAAAKENLSEQIGQLRALLSSLDEEHDRFDHLVTLGAVYELEGRQRWLAAVEKRLT